MNLIQEFSIKIIIFTFCLAFALEATVLIFILLTSKNILNKVYNQTIENTENKAMEFTNSLKTITANIFMKYVTDLKLIARNTYIYNSLDSKTFNKNSKVFKNNMNNKKIISENKTQLLNNHNDIFKNIYNNETDKFDYLNYYINLYGNETDNSKTQDKLLKEHDELNYINYIN